MKFHDYIYTLILLPFYVFHYLIIFVYLLKKKFYFNDFTYFFIILF